MRRVGWYLLPRSGTPYHGPIPDGVEEVPDPVTGELAAQQQRTPDTDDELVVVLDGTVDEIAAQAEAYPVEVVRRLIEQEYAGQNRTTLLERLDRIAKRQEDASPAS
jgi:hypothetical protein